MERQNIDSGSTFEEKIGYSRAVIKGDWIFVSGTTGYDYDTMKISEDVREQAEQCFINIQRTLRKAGADLSDIVRVTYILPKVEDFEICWPVIKKYLGNIKPAATMFSAGLAEKEMKIEIQVTALNS